MSADNGRTCTSRLRPRGDHNHSDVLVVYLGTSSNWSFTRRVLSLTHEHIYQEALPTGALLFDGAAYDLGWDGLRATQSPDTPAVPTFDHAIYLINAVKFRCGQLYHLFDENEFMSNLHEFYLQPKPNTTAGLWYIHFLLILAFGKGFVQHKLQGNKPAGAEIFVKALQLLPDVSLLHQEPIESTEILCCVALYLQALDCRSSAHNYVCHGILLLPLRQLTNFLSRSDRPCGWQWRRACIPKCQQSISEKRRSKGAVISGGPCTSWTER